MPVTSMRETVKGVLGGMASLSPQARYPRAIFILAHMRCGSTALSNILCSRADVSGYGESHVRYVGRASLGRLIVNQTLRKAYKPQARYLFDKVLHDRHDSGAGPAFFDARAIFVVRRPGAAVRSIRALYDGLQRDEYGTDAAAMDYYLTRVASLCRMWDRFDPARRVGMTHATLITDPDAALAQVSSGLAITPPLENRYVSLAASMKGGGGDPTASGKHTRIEARADDPAKDGLDALDVPDSQRREAQALYDGFAKRVANTAP